MSYNIQEKAKALVEAIYANMDTGEFRFDKESDLPMTKGKFIVGIHIRDELFQLEEALEPSQERQS